MGLSGTLEASLVDTAVNGFVTTHLDPGQTLVGELAFEGTAGAWPVTVSGDYRYGDRFLEATGRLRSGAVFDLPFMASQDFESGTGVLSVADQIDISEGVLTATAIDWTEPFDLDRGSVLVDGSFEWGDEDPTGSLTLQFENVGAHYDDYLVSGIEGKLDVDLRGSSWRLASAMTDGRLFVGFPISNISFELSGDESKLSVKNARGDLLGGSASADPFDYDGARGSASINLTLIDIDLAQLLALEGDDVTGTGRLSGGLPVQVSGNLPTVHNGMVRATGPGTIRLSSVLVSVLTPLGVDVSNLRALENFHYDLLESDVSYQANGDLLLGVRLEGRNPDYEKGQRYHYNVNLSNNIPVLLRSLRLAGEISEQLEKKLRQ